MQINATFSKDSSDCIATLSSAAECIEFLVSLPDISVLGSGTGSGEGGDAEQPVMATLERTFTMSFDEVRNMLSWSSRDDIIAHPLHDLDVLLCVSASLMASVAGYHCTASSVLIGLTLPLGWAGQLISRTVHLYSAP